MKVILKRALLLSMNIYLYTHSGPLEESRWYFMPKIGSAPTVLTHVSFASAVIPKLGVTCPIEVTSAPTTITCEQIFTSPENMFTQAGIRPKFREEWHLCGVHVGGEIGYNTSDGHYQYFAELTYDHIAGRNGVPVVNNLSKHSPGCSSCEFEATGPTLTTFVYTHNYGVYSSIGGYLGMRYFFDIKSCEKLSPFLGGKIGVRHTKKMNVDLLIDPLVIDGVTVFDKYDTTYATLCNDRALSAGIQCGLEYYICDGVVAMGGFEVVAIAPWKPNSNIILPKASSPIGLNSYAEGYPTNLAISPHGHLLQFPLWAGLRFEWGK